MKILYVEDDELARVGLATVLTHRGHTVNAAEDADCAVALMRANAYDLVLLDTVFPPGKSLEDVSFGETGKELLLGLRCGRFGQLKTSAQVAVVVISGVMDLDIIRSLEGAEIKMLLAKPIDPEDAADLLFRATGEP